MFSSLAGILFMSSSFRSITFLTDWRKISNWKDVRLQVSLVTQEFLNQSGARLSHSGRPWFQCLQFDSRVNKSGVRPRFSPRRVNLQTGERQTRIERRRETQFFRLESVAHYRPDRVSSGGPPPSVSWPKRSETAFGIISKKKVNWLSSGIIDPSVSRTGVDSISQSTLGHSFHKSKFSNSELVVSASPWTSRFWKLCSVLKG